jgi:4-alpha-glucanotransferase
MPLKTACPILGDVPMFVAHNSADCWAHQDQFDLDEAGNPSSVAGVPPDYFSADGQLWGNPLYDYQAMARDNYQWWTDRFRRMMDLVDEVRVDHFRGFAAYWAVPAGSETAKSGAWKDGPRPGPLPGGLSEKSAGSAWSPKTWASSPTMCAP